MVEQALEHRRCSKCGETKPPAAFSKSRNPHVWCRSCCRRNAAEWRQKNGERNQEAERQRASRRRATPESRRWMYDYRLLTKYGLTREEFDALILNQEGRCAICDRDPRDNLMVDHNHLTGVVRGLLCATCNRGLGLLGDDLGGLQRAIDYLRRT